VIIDTSAMIAILLDEQEAPAFLEEIVASTRRWLPAPALVEASAVMMARVGPGGDVALDALLRRLDIEIVEMSAEAARAARSAYARYGKGVGSPAVLNFGDCLSYGVAAASGEPLLFKGTDFLQTDVKAAI
jgi:ribonuclease VapC